LSTTQDIYLLLFALALSSPAPVLPAFSIPIPT
jgi:hypothetical protein